jgi:hypothetical protein
MAQAIPGCRGLFSQLQLALNQRTGHRVKLNQAARDHIADFDRLAQDVSARPTRLAEIVPSKPRYKGLCDAAKAGMGGVWLPDTTDTQPPIVWRMAFPPTIQQRVCSDVHPQGDVTNSDLELAGTIAHEAALASTFDCRECTLAAGCDNVAAVSWRTKGSTSTAGPASYLLREASLQQRFYRYQSYCFYVPGVANHLADVASRRFDLTDSQLVDYFNRVAPHSQSWHVVNLPPTVSSKLTSPLLKKRPGGLSVSSVPKPSNQFGTNVGSRTVPLSDTTTHTSAHSVTRSRFSKSLLSESGTVDAPAVVSRFTLKPYEMTFYRFRRRSPHWGSPIPV